MDHAKKSLESILESGEYEEIPGVPLFDEHDEYDREGKLVRKFDKSRLEKIAQYCNERAKTDLSPIGPGHTIDGAPETSQPAIWAYTGNNWHVKDFNGRPTLHVSFYVKKEVEVGRDKTGRKIYAPGREEVMSYPRRSVELYRRDPDGKPIAGFIDWVALLRRTPQRDLGLLTYAKGQFARIPSDGVYFGSADKKERIACGLKGDKLCYSMESHPMDDPTIAPDAKAGDPEFQEKCDRYMKATFPHLGRMHEESAARYAQEEEAKREAELAASSDADLAGPQPGQPDNGIDESDKEVSDGEERTDAEPPKKEEPIRMSKTAEQPKVTKAPASPAPANGHDREIKRLQKLIDDMQADRQADKDRYSKKDAERRVKALEDDGYAVVEKDAERFAKFATDEERDEYEKELRETRRCDGPTDVPIGDIPERFARTADRGNGDGELDGKTLDKALNYMRSNGCSYETAVAKFQKAK